MSDALRELYQEVIVDHGKRPRNFHVLEGATHTAEGFNPLCGDQLRIYLRLADGVIEDIAFQGQGCAIAQASASLLTLAVKGMRQEQALALFARVHALLTEGPGSQAAPETLGKLAVLAGVWEFPLRVKCASLAWHTLRSALAGDPAPVTTE
ncbi:SUF system NifU family Fe-S cluster assembly protein [Pseudomonas sp. SA3-5]|uniref:SUF system NifU family Fe-S cluster assembly protein n=1 Tax=Pseudomonas aestuarii TaxID=3018340 RepID=A0ABT4XEE6_9PSED|nr:SUF system NifU family Fe-S cluster assembly protein [Pseudomonas aestuarii]MDA7086578.1 SUF system NifU family Fe-S cluster assembly protein [Pseudomonas aestuarii]